MEIKTFLKKNLIIICTVIFIFLICCIPIISRICQDNNLYKTMIVDVENKNWLDAKVKLDTLNSHGVSDCSKYEKTIYYNYYIIQGDMYYKKNELHDALKEYKYALTFNVSDKILEEKIKKLEKECKRLDEIEYKKAEQERIKAEQEREKERKRQEEIEANKPSINKLVILSKGFGYSEYGEASVIGKIKNNNKQAVWARADIDLLDSQGNITGNTYTYQQVGAGEIWNFTAPTFGTYATNMKINLSIE